MSMYFIQIFAYVVSIAAASDAVQDEVMMLQTSQTMGATVIDATAFDVSADGDVKSDGDDSSSLMQTGEDRNPVDPTGTADEFMMLQMSQSNANHHKPNMMKAKRSSGSQSASKDVFDVQPDMDIMPQTDAHFLEHPEAVSADSVRIADEIVMLQTGQTHSTFDVTPEGDVKFEHELTSLLQAGMLQTVDVLPDGNLHQEWEAGPLTQMNAQTEAVSSGAVGPVTVADEVAMLQISQNTYDVDANADVIQDDFDMASLMETGVQPVSENRSISVDLNGATVQDRFRNAFATATLLQR